MYLRIPWLAWEDEVRVEPKGRLFKVASSAVEVTGMASADGPHSTNWRGHNFQRGTSTVPAP